MNISKISRSLVVAIFVAFIIFLSYLDILAIINKAQGVQVISNLVKLGYACLLITLVLLYVYIKTKLYKLKIKRKISFVYRYIYLFIIIAGNSFFTLYKTLPEISAITKITCAMLLLVTAFCIKKIIFNVSKSDILSVFGMFAFSMLPNVILDKDIFLNSLLITSSFIGVLLLLQLIIDELKQRGLRNKKYIIYSIIAGILMGITILLGINIIIYLILSVVLVFITINLDNTHISFPKKIMNNITQQKRESLYKIEMININKLIYTIFIYLFISLIIIFAGKFTLKKLPNNISNIQVLNNINENIEKTKITNLNENINLNINSILKDIFTYSKEFVNFSKTYYMVIFVYIVLIELLAFMLKRRYDTKSTVMKLMLVCIFVVSSIFKLNILYIQPLITTICILIAIVNTSNIYLNREERVKMLVA